MEALLRNANVGVEPLALTLLGAAGTTSGSLNLQGRPSPRVAARRRLQEEDDACDGSLFYLTSSLFKESEGCYQLTAVDSVYATEGGQNVVIPLPISSSAESEIVWVTAGAIGNSDNGALAFDPECHSEEDTTSAYPWEVTAWYCDMDGSGTVYSEVPESGLSFACGCPADTIPATIPFASPGPTPAAVPIASPSPTASTREIGTSGPTPATSALGTPAPLSVAAVSAAPTAANACTGLDPFTVAVEMASLDDVEGCYAEAGPSYNVEGGYFFSLTGTSGTGQMAVFPGYIDAASTEARWYVGYYANTMADSIVYCVSDKSPAEVHPSAALWYCDFTGQGLYPLAPATQFSVTCGCLSSSSSATAMGGTPIPASPRSFTSVTPTSSPTMAPTSAVAEEVITPTPAPTTSSRGIDVVGGPTSSPTAGDGAADSISAESSGIRAWGGGGWSLGAAVVMGAAGLFVAVM